MGMSASQVRFLSLQSRRSSIGREMTSLSHRKMALSRDMDKVARRYTNALNNISLKYSNDAGQTYNDLTYDLLMKPNALRFETPYIISDSNGRVVVDRMANLVGYDHASKNYITLTDKTITQGPLRGQKLNYENIAKWITQTEIKGGPGEITTDTLGQTTGTANPNAYVVPDKAETYGFNNTLRYQIFEELGLVNAGTSAQYLAMLNNYYGSEEAQEFGNYSELLQRFIANDFQPLGSIGNRPVSGKAAQYSTYFGHYNGNKYVGGCLLGNLALAQNAVTEYDRWCNELKDFNLAKETRHVFTATGGRSHTFVVPAFLDMNSNADEGGNGGAHVIGQEALDELKILTGSAANRDEIDMGPYPGSGLHYDMLREIYYNNAWIEVDSGSPLTQINTFISLIDGALASGKSYQNEATGETWQFNADSAFTDQNVMITGKDGALTQMNVCDAAKKYAMDKTISFYTTTFATGKTYEINTGRSYGGGHSRKASENAEFDVNHMEFDTDLEQYQGVISETKKYRWYERLLAGLLAIVSFAELLANPIAWVTEAFGWTNLHEFGPDMLDIALYGEGNKGYTYNLANVEKSYYTFYQMYMNAYQDSGVNLLNAENTENTPDTAKTVQHEYKNNVIMDMIDQAGLDNNSEYIRNQNVSKIYDVPTCDTVYDTVVDFKTYNMIVDTIYDYDKSETITTDCTSWTNMVIKVHTFTDSTEVDTTGTIFDEEGNIIGTEDNHPARWNSDYTKYDSTRTQLEDGWDHYYSTYTHTYTSNEDHTVAVNNGKTFYEDPAGEHYHFLLGFTTYKDENGLGTKVDGTFYGKRFTFYDTHIDEGHHFGSEYDYEKYLTHSDQYDLKIDENGKYYYSLKDDDHIYYLEDVSSQYDLPAMSKFQAYFLTEFDTTPGEEKFYLSNGGYYIAKSVEDENEPGKIENRRWINNLLLLTFADRETGIEHTEEIKYEVEYFKYEHEKKAGGMATGTMSLCDYTLKDSQGRHLFGFYYDSNTDTDDIPETIFTIADDLILYRSQISFLSECTEVDDDGNPIAQETETDKYGNLISTYTRCAFSTDNIRSLISRENSEKGYDYTLLNTNSDGKVTGTYVDSYVWDKETGKTTERQRAYYFDKIQTAINTGVDSSDPGYATQFNRVVEICDAQGNIVSTRYFMNQTEVFPKRTENSVAYEYKDLLVAVDKSQFTDVISAFITPSNDFKNELQQDINNVYDEIYAAQAEMENFFSAKERKLMNFYDAMFKRIATEGWVTDTTINNTEAEKSQQALNNKLQNNMYFIASCTVQEYSVNYKYNKHQATSVQEIFEVHDEQAETEAYAEYEAERQAIENKEEAIDLRMARLETENEAINEELEAVKNMRNKNIDRYFKIFG